MQKMTVVSDQGFKIFGTIPNSFLEMVESMYELKDKNVSFSASIQRSENDSKFGFFKKTNSGKTKSVGEKNEVTN